MNTKLVIKDTVWGQAIRRFAELCLVQLAKYRHTQARAMARGTHEPTTKNNNEMEPLASIQRDGTLPLYSLKNSQKNYKRRTDTLTTFNGPMEPLTCTTGSNG
jgi:hypothetical protein